MNAEFLFFADLVLLLRLGGLFGDRPLGARGWIVKTAVEAAAATLLLPLDVGAIGVVATSVLVNGASLAWERTGRDRNALQLGLGLAQLALLSV